ncbi:hypothetical protein JNW88_15725, partial [Micromonospora sp. ATA32]|nr:hypothetical protein [Micromonospora sp. ATA32]
LAGPVLAAGGYRAVGAASVLACLLAAAVASRFPEHRTPGDPPATAAGTPPGTGQAAAVEDTSERGDLGWAASLRVGLAEARADRSVRGALLLVPAVTAVWGRSTSTRRCWRAVPVSLAGMATDLTIIAVYGGYAVAATAGGDRVAFALAAVPYLVVAFGLAVRGNGHVRAGRARYGQRRSPNGRAK